MRTSPSHALVALLAVSCTNENKVTRFNAAPEAAITSHSDGDSIYEDVEIELRGAVSDPDHAADLLSVTWSRDGEVICEADADADGGTTCTAAFDEDGGDVQLQVSDPEGKAHTATLSLDVVGTEAPSITLLSPTTEGTYYSNETIEFSATVEDAEDDPRRADRALGEQRGRCAGPGQCPGRPRAAPRASAT